MRSVVIIEVNELFYPESCLCNALEAFLLVDNLRLDGSVHTFRNCIVSRLVVLCHADAYVVLLELVYVDVAAVLHASVRVMDEPAQIVPACLGNCHLKGIERIFCL